MAKEKKRFDILVGEKFPSLSRTYIQSLIMQGKVFVDGKPITKAGTLIDVTLELDVKDKDQKYASRAGFKLEAALDHFKVDVKGLVVLDAGLSTGGFTDCMLQRGVKKVYGVDVGYGQVHEKIRRDERVEILERTNLRNLESLPRKVDLATLDLSFISLLTVMPAVINLLKDDGKIITLIKPQFEAGRAYVGKGGIVRDENVHKKVIEKIKNGMRNLGFEMVGVIDSPIRGAEGNKEFLALFERKK
jgi:23S rRNA (cytidine1920-2'-O)/16S rRNA (cytidine1409-2'-O)-methyltransferase